MAAFLTAAIITAILGTVSFLTLLGFTYTQYQRAGSFHQLFAQRRFDTIVIYTVAEFVRFSVLMCMDEFNAAWHSAIVQSCLMASLLAHVWLLHLRSNTHLIPPKAQRVIRMLITVFNMLFVGLVVVLFTLVGFVYSGHLDYQSYNTCETPISTASLSVIISVMSGFLIIIIDFSYGYYFYRYLKSMKQQRRGSLPGKEETVVKGAGGDNSVSASLKITSLVAREGFRITCFTLFAAMTVVGTLTTLSTSGTAISPVLSAISHGFILGMILMWVHLRYSLVKSTSAQSRLAEQAGPVNQPTLQNPAFPPQQQPGSPTLPTRKSVLKPLKFQRSDHEVFVALDLEDTTSTAEREQEEDGLKFETATSNPTETLDKTHIAVSQHNRPVTYFDGLVPSGIDHVTTENVM